MVSRVLYRPFEESDFDAIASILQRVWHNTTSNDEYNFLEACRDLAHSLSISTFSQVALIDQEPRGIVLARSGEVPAPDCEHWQAIETRLFDRMHDLNARAAEFTRCYARSEVKINNLLLEQSGLSPANQITLLAVDKSVHGLGIGGVLLDAACSYLSAQGGLSAYLYTDSDCSWKFYEHKGLKRAATHKSTREERKLLPREMYLYGLDLSA